MKLSWLQTDYNVSRKLKKITFFYSLLPKVKLQCNDIECVGCQAVGTRVLMRNNLMLYIVIFSLFICGSIESRFDRIHRTTNIRKEPKKIVRYLLFPPSLSQRGKPDYLNIFFPHLNSIVGLFFYLFICFCIYYWKLLPLCAIRRIQSTCKCPGSLCQDTRLPCRISAGQSHRLCRPWISNVL